MTIIEINNKLRFKDASLKKRKNILTLKCQGSNKLTKTSYADKITGQGWWKSDCCYHILCYMCRSSLQYKESRHSERLTSRPIGCKTLRQAILGLIQFTPFSHEPVKVPHLAVTILEEKDRLPHSVLVWGLISELTQGCLSLIINHIIHLFI